MTSIHEEENKRVEPAPGVGEQIAGLKNIFIRPLSILFVRDPLGAVFGGQGAGRLADFQLDRRATADLNFLASLPLAAVLGASIEALAGHVGQMIGGLLSAIRRTCSWRDRDG